MFDIVRSEMALTLRQLCKETGRLSCKALFFFWDEKMTEIAPTRLIIEKSIDLKEGMTVTQGSYTTGPSKFQDFSRTFQDHIY